MEKKIEKRRQRRILRRERKCREAWREESRGKRMEGEKDKRRVNMRDKRGEKNKRENGEENKE